MNARERKTRSYFLFITALLFSSIGFSFISQALGVLEYSQSIPYTGEIKYASQPPNPTLHTEGARILDGNEQEFVPFGFNTFMTAMPASWDIDRPPEQPTTTLLNQLKGWKVNLVRINIAKELWDSEAGYKEYIDQWVDGLAFVGIRSYLDFYEPWATGSGHTNREIFEWHYEAMTIPTRKQEVFDLYDEWIERYRSNEYMVGICLINEPIGWPPDYSFPITEEELNAAWRNFVVEAIQHIHSKNPDLLVFVNGGGVNWGGDLRPFMGSVPAKGNAVYTLHHYPDMVLRDGEPWPFTDNYAQDYQNGDLTNGYTHLKDLLYGIAFKLLEDNVPVMIEEFSVTPIFGNNWERVYDDFYKICYSEADQKVGVLHWSIYGGERNILQSDWSSLTPTGQKWVENLNRYA